VTAGTVSDDGNAPYFSPFSSGSVDPESRHRSSAARAFANGPVSELIPACYEPGSVRHLTAQNRTFAMIVSAVQG
jgi:hypothetical protein